MQLYLVGALLFALLVAIFAVQNSAPVDIRFLTWEFRQISLVIVILGSAAVGAVFVLCLGLLKQFRLARTLRNVQAENKKLTEQLARLGETQISTGENGEAS
ncbi:MAG: hypothetical protein PWP65_1436 [Clostridia bacterium]|nr:hypothetical protein [Clostridia bacterium]